MIRPTKEFRPIIYVVIFISLTFACSQKKVAWRGKTEVQNGVEVVKNPAEPVFSQPILFLEEDLNLTGASVSQFLFYKLKELDVDERENIYVNDWMGGCIHVFDRSGKFVRTIGRKGQGPGEFQRPMDICVFDNQLIVHDLERCLSFFTLEGKFLRSLTSKNALGLWDVYCDAEGNIVVQDFLFDPNNPKFAFIKYDRDMNLILQFAESPYPGYAELVNNPFAPLSSVAVDRNGNMIFGYPEKYAVEVFNPQGKPTMRIERDYQPLKLSNADKKEMREENPRLTKFDYPKCKSAYRRFFLDDEGRIYVGTWEKAGGRNTYFYDIFDRDGKYLSRVRLNEKPQLARKGMLYSIEKDDEGYQSIKRYKMIWRQDVRY